jgi:hypothetical protein
LKVAIALRLTIPKHPLIKDYTLAVDSLASYKVAAPEAGLRLHPRIFALPIADDFTFRILQYLMLKASIVPGFFSVVDAPNIHPSSV